jgi:hypothetical protein
MPSGMPMISFITVADSSRRDSSFLPANSGKENSNNIVDNVKTRFMVPPDCGI